MITASRKLRVYLCHASSDMDLVYEFYRRLNAQTWIDLLTDTQRLTSHAWIDLLLDNKKILQGRYREGQTLYNSHVVIVFLSKTAIEDDNFLNEVGSVLEPSQNENGEPILVVIKLDDCEIPKQLAQIQFINYAGNEEDKVIAQENLLELLLACERRLMKDELSPLFNNLIPASRQLRVLICCASQDRPIATQISNFLGNEKWIATWLIDENLYQVNAYQKKVELAIRETDVVIVLLSEDSVSKKGYEEKEFYGPLANAQRKEDGSVLLIPVRLNNYIPPPRFQSWHWLDYFINGAHDKLLEGLRSFAGKPGIKPAVKIEQSNTQVLLRLRTRSSESQEDLELYSLVEIPFDPGREPNHAFLISQYPVTVAQYERFLRSANYSDKSLWMKFRKYDENCRYIGEWADEGYKWMKQRREYFASYPSEMSRVQPHNWQDPDLTLVGLNKPVIGITWYEASAYCNWLTMHWKEITEFVDASKLETSLDIYFRLPLETEWLRAAVFCQTKPPHNYPNGRTPAGVFYVPPFLQEWLANYRFPDHIAMCLGEMFVNEDLAEMARQSYRHSSVATLTRDFYGFRIVAVSVKNE